MKNEKTDEIHCTEIKNEILLLHERWEKLEKLSQRLHKRQVVLFSKRGIFCTELVVRPPMFSKSLRPYLKKSLTAAEKL